MLNKIFTISVSPREVTEKSQGVWVVLCYVRGYRILRPAVHNGRGLSV
jgi:hypothetical protein